MTNIANWNITIFNGEIHYLNGQRVSTIKKALTNNEDDDHNNNNNNNNKNKNKKKKQSRVNQEKDEFLVANFKQETWKVNQQETR